MTRACIDCGRHLALDAEHFYPRSDGANGGFTGACRECFKASSRERDRERVARAKHCIGPCDRMLPPDEEHFERGSSGNLRRYCRECLLAAELARDIERAERERPKREAAAERQRERDEAAARREAEAARAETLEDRTAELTAALGPLVELTADLPGEPATDLTTPEGRAAALRKQTFRAELNRPPFDAAELFLEMVECAEDGGAQSGLGALAAALKRLDLVPELETTEIPS